MLLMGLLVLSHPCCGALAFPFQQSTHYLDRFDEACSLKLLDLVGHGCAEELCPSVSGDDLEDLIYLLLKIHVLCMSG